MNNRKADIRSNISLMFTAILLVGIFAFIGISFISSLDNARTFTARTAWRNEAIMLSNRLVSDPNCLAYTRLILRYTNESGIDVLTSEVLTVPLTIDRNKLFTNGQLDLTRITNCVKLDSSEYKMFISISLTELIRGTEYTYGPVNNLDPLLYKNAATLETVDLPIKVIDENGFNYAVLSISMSVNTEYFKAKIL